MSLSTYSDLDRNIDDDSDNESEFDKFEIEDDKKELIKIKNPFFSRDKIIVDTFISKILNLNQKEIVSNFSSLYIICQKNNGVITDKFYEEEISIKDLENFIDNLVIIEGNFKMLYNTVHKSACVVINSSYLSLFKSNIKFEDNELILPLINLSENNVRLYLKQFDGMFTIKDYITTKIVNEFYKNNSSSIVSNFCVNIINSMEESNYWNKRFNTKLNITNKFINRGFNLTLNQRVKDANLKLILKEVNEIPREGDNYFGFLYRKQKYVDISSSISKNGYTLYRISDSKENLSNGDVEYLLRNCQNNYEIYKLLCNLLVSKDYCHLILNDPVKLMMLSKGLYYDKRYPQINILNKYILAFKYAIGYSWLTFYTEESIKKTKITDDDRFVFSINTASQLPSFPLHYENIHHNPYLPILISREIIDINNNCVGVDATNKGNVFGVVNLETFKKNFNIFLCGEPNVDLLKGLNWNNIGISGSVIPACITKYNPLEGQFNSKNRYFNEYYCNSDIDVMCNIQDPFQYIDKANEFYNVIIQNCDELMDTSTSKIVNMISVKSAALIVNESFIRKNIVKDNSELTYDYVFTNLDDLKVKKEFYKFYITWKIAENEKYMETSQWKDKKYIDYFDIVPVEDIIIVFARTKDDWDKYWKDVEKNNQKNATLSEDLEELEKEYFNTKDVDSDELDEVMDDENVLFKCHENLKFKIKSKYLNHDFEFFKTKYEGSFFSTVSQFHLPCVRGYYNGNDVKLLPSCISAAMTLVNIDYKYFAGSKDPIEIINKYRMRGYTTLLNDSERIRLVSYSNKVEKWNKLYGEISKSSNNSINSIFGPKPISYTLFKPRSINADLFKEIKPVDFNYIYKESDSTPLDKENYGIIDLEKVKTALSVMDELTTIGKFGYVKQVKKWYFDYIYENF